VEAKRKCHHCLRDTRCEKRSKEKVGWAKIGFDKLLPLPTSSPSFPVVAGKSPSVNLDASYASSTFENGSIRTSGWRLLICDDASDQKTRANDSGGDFGFVLTTPNHANDAGQRWREGRVCVCPPRLTLT